jgi:vacuolar-type H+-ATPase subunit E/Vma4
MLTVFAVNRPRPPQLKARSMQLEQREIILNEVFEEARRQLGSVTAHPDYAAIAMMMGARGR